MALHPIPLPCALAFPPPASHRDATTPSLLGPSFHDPRTHHVLESHPERAAPLSRLDDERCHAIGSHSVFALRLYLAAYNTSSICRFSVLDHLCSNLSESFHPISLPCALAFPPPSHRDTTTLSPCWAPHFMTQERIMFSIPPRASRASLPPRRSIPRHRFSLRPCTAPPSCSLQPLLKLSLLSLRPSLLQFVSIDSLLLNHKNPIFEPVCVFYLFLFCLYFCDRNELHLQVPVCNLVVITTAIPLLLFP